MSFLIPLYARLLLACGQTQRAAELLLRQLAHQPTEAKPIKRFFQTLDKLQSRDDQLRLIDQLLSLVKVEPDARKQHILPSRLIVSLTSYSKRFATLHYTLRSLLSQRVRSDRTILWIAHEDRPLLPQNVLALQAHGLEIYFCEDLRSYKKILPSLKDEPSATIVTADDDVYYPPDWLEKLVAHSARYPNRVVAYRARRIKLNKDGVPLSYRSWKIARQWSWRRWKWTNPSVDSSAPELLFPTGVGGVLYPPRALFSADTSLLERIQQTAPLADDVGLYWMWRMNGVLPCLVEGKKFQIVTWPESQVETLMRVNIGGNQNDMQIKKMIANFGAAVFQR